MTYHYMILGAGRQGTAAAYDLAKFGEAHKITLADLDLQVAHRAAERVNALVGQPVAVGMQLDAGDRAAVQAAFQDVDVALSAVPYYFNLEITRAAIASRTHLCDMGGNTEVVFSQLALDEEAKAQGISIVPDCGMGPGLINTMGAYLVGMFDEPQEILIYDGGLPQQPVPPWNYELFFHINGLTNEYDGKTAFLRNGEITWVDGLTELETVHIPPLGTLEACITTGGVSTAPYTWLGKLKTYQNKTLRYPGHFVWFQGFKELGLFSETPVQVGDQVIIPREFYHTLLKPRLQRDAPRDVCVMRVIGRGVENGQETEITLDLVDYYDPETGFLAMERLTGWHCAIMMGFQARGAVRPGGVRQELAVPPADFMAELPKRGITYALSFSPRE